VERKCHKERVRRVARRQSGRISLGQLLWLGATRGLIREWLATGYLVEVLPRVYAVGHDAPIHAGDLWAAVLYGGPGSMLSHGTAAHWRGLINFPPPEIQISTPHQVPSLPGLVVRGRRRGLERALYNGIPVTTTAQTVLDLAATHERNVVRHALAQLDYRRQLHVPSLIAIAGKGKAGSASLKLVIADHQPKLALVNGHFEFKWLVWMEERGIEPLPEYMEIVCGFLVDCHWPDHGYVVELDGVDGHSTPAQMKFDRGKDFAIRQSGRVVHRYDWDLVHERPDAVEAEIRRTLSEREGWSGTRAAS
jgi:hypothetical protein